MGQSKSFKDKYGFKLKMKNYNIFTINKYIMFEEPEYYKLIEDFDQKLMELFENTFNNQNKGFTISEITKHFNTQEKYIDFLMNIREKHPCSFYQFGVYTCEKGMWKMHKKN